MKTYLYMYIIHKLKNGRRGALSNSKDGALKAQVQPTPVPDTPRRKT